MNTNHTNNNPWPYFVVLHDENKNANNNPWPYFVVLHDENTNCE